MYILNRTQLKTAICEIGFISSTNLQNVCGSLLTIFLFFEDWIFYMCKNCALWTSISGYCLGYIQFITFLFHLYNTGSSLVLKRKGTHVSILHKEKKQVKTKPHPFICLRIQNVIFMSIIFFTHILKKHVLPVSAENTGYQSIDINSQQLQSL